MMFTMIADYISLSTMYIRCVYTLPRLTAPNHESFMLPISKKVNKKGGLCNENDRGKIWRHPEICFSVWSDVTFVCPFDPGSWKEEKKVFILHYRECKKKNIGETLIFKAGDILAF